MEKRNEIVEISFEFAHGIIGYSELIEENRKYVIPCQLLKLGTSIGANKGEPQGAESKTDFVHKLKIAHKEAEETEYWMLLCEKADAYPSPPNNIKTQLLSIQKLLTKIIATSKTRR